MGVKKEDLLRWGSPFVDRNVCFQIACPLLNGGIEGHGKPLSTVMQSELDFKKTSRQDLLSKLGA